MKFAIYNLLFICLVIFLINMHEAKKSSRPKSGLFKPTKNENEVAKRRFKNQKFGVKKAKNSKNQKKLILRTPRRKKNKSKEVAKRKTNSKKYPSKQRKKQNVKNNRNRKIPSKKKKKGKQLSKRKKKNLNNQKSRKANKGKKRNKTRGNGKKAKIRKGKKKNKKHRNGNKKQIKKNGKNKRTKKEGKIKRNGKKNRNPRTKSRKSFLDEQAGVLQLNALDDYFACNTYPELGNPYREIVVKFPEHSTIKYIKLFMFDPSNFYLLYSPTFDDVRYDTDEVRFTIIERCYNNMRGCIAFWSGECLTERYHGNILGILLTKSTTDQMKNCRYWNTTEEPLMKSYGHNQCTRLLVDGILKGNPWCYSSYGTRTNCFVQCDNNITETILSVNNTLSIQHEPDKGKVTMRRINATALTAEQYQSTTEYNRCFDSSWQCVALRAGECVERSYSKTVAYVFLNSRNSATGKTCMPWTNTNYANKFHDPSQNICLQRIDRGGPWCYIKNNRWELCFPNCTADPAVLPTSVNAGAANRANCDLFAIQFCDSTDTATRDRIALDAQQYNCPTDITTTDCQDKH